MPYVYHPFHLAEQMDSEYAVCVALLHDVAEDTDITLEDLRKEGSHEVIEALSLMTHDDSVPYMEYIRGLRGNPLAVQVKLADLAHNSDLSRLDVVDDAAKERCEKYHRAMELLQSAPDAVQDRIRGSLIGGAAGDALGYPVEFISEKEIVNRYGSGGIQEYELSRHSHKALISDDTQMTLFSAAAVLTCLSRSNRRGIAGEPRMYANFAYQGSSTSTALSKIPSTIPRAAASCVWPGWHDRHRRYGHDPTVKGGGIAAITHNHSLGLAGRGARISSTAASAKVRRSGKS